MNSNLFLSLLTAHVIADFYLQTDGYCRQKKEKKLKSPFLYVHSLIVGLTAWAIVPTVSFAPFAFLLAVTHWMIDTVKVYSPSGMWSFLADQVAHIVLLILVAITFDSPVQLPLEWLRHISHSHAPMFLLAVLLCIKPANLVIKLILQQYQVGENQSCANIKNAGALIGNLERLLTLLFVIIGQYEAIGFIIAAKSILRFKDTDTAKTEYVLAGTFLSFGIAFVCGLATLYCH